MQKFLNQLANALDAESVVTEPDALAKLGACTTGTRRSLLAAVFPSTTQEVQAVVRLAHSHRVPLYPVSTGRNWGYGTANPVVDGCALVSLARMRRIFSVDRELGTATLEPGVTQGDLAGHISAENLPFMVPTTGAGPTASIVGNALERGYGITPHGDHFGAVLAIEAVLADGSIYRSPFSDVGVANLAQAYKWGVGPYIDGLFAQGAFGIVTRMTLALARRPECIKACLFRIREETLLEPAVDAIRESLWSLGTVVGGINLLNVRRVLAMSVPYPRERIGEEGVIADSLLAELARRHGVAPWTGFGTLYGTTRMVNAAVKELRKLLSPYVSQVVFAEQSRVRQVRRFSAGIPIIGTRFTPLLRTLESALDLVGGHPNETALPLAYWKTGGKRGEAPLDPARDGCGLIWYAPLVEMKPASVRDYVKFVSATMRKHRLEPLITLTSVSERCFDSTVPILFDSASAEDSARAHACHLELLETGRSRGFFPYRVGIDAMDWLTGQGTEHWKIVARLKASLDPDNLIAPGRYAPLKTGTPN